MSVSVTKRGSGRGSAVAPIEADEIRWAFVAEGKSISQIARDTGRSREAIRGVLQARETEDLRQVVQREKRERARMRLAANTDKAADAWIKSLDIAADKGDHRPAKDLLLTERVVEPVGADASAPLIVSINGIHLFGIAQPEAERHE